MVPSESSRAAGAGTVDLRQICARKALALALSQAVALT